MGNVKRNILIVGAGRAGSALIRTLKEDPSVHIAGVVDKDDKAAGVAVARQLKIPVANIWKDFLKNGSLDEIINATGNEDVHKALLKEKSPKTVLLDSSVAKTLWFFAKEHETVERKIQEAKEEVEAHEWGVRKTNEAIKRLYKELEEKNKELQALDRLKSDFISTVSHELRTPLAIIKEALSLIQDGVLGGVNEKQGKVLATATDSVDRLSRLITGLLDISKIEAGNIEIERSLVSLTQIAKQVTSLFELTAKDKGLDLRLKTPGTGINVYADHDKIVQVFTNLIGNSIKFTEKGYIEVSVEERPEEIECSVTDTGKGVSKEDIPKMFVKFQQIDRVHGDGEKGTGLGLSIAKSIVELHGGDIRAESEPGKGTKFIFTLPKYTEKKFLEEYIDKNFKTAQKTNTRMSLMKISIADTDKLGGSVSEEKLYAVLKGIEGILKNDFAHPGGAVLKDLRECIAVLPDSDKQKALTAGGRLKQAVDDYLVREKLADKVHLKFECLTYPDDVKDAEELVQKIMKK
jgi:signal transduction histidine kinase